MSAATRILALVQANPEIGSNDATHVANLVSRAMLFIAQRCNLPQFPDLLQGYSKSNLAPSTNLSALSTNGINLYVNGSTVADLDLTLANCTNGDLTAAELQTQIRAEADDDNYGFSEVTVVYNDDTVGSEYYLITSGRYGETSSIEVTCDYDEPEVCRAMKLSPVYGGTQLPGSERCDALEQAAVALCEAFVTLMGMEGLKQATIDDMTVAAYNLPPIVMSLMQSKQRLWQ